MYLFKVLIGCKPNGRHTEQHDVFFGIAESMQALVPQLKEFWPEAVSTMHIDAYRKVENVNGYKVQIVPKGMAKNTAALFFINLGGYKQYEFEEYHYKMIVAAEDKANAIKEAKQTAFYKHTGFSGAPSHVDDKYGIDVDDVYAIEDILAPALKEKYSIQITEGKMPLPADDYSLGYYILKKIEAGIYETD
jgi:hypothetical protein